MDKLSGADNQNFIASFNKLQSAMNYISGQKEQEFGILFSRMLKKGNPVIQRYQNFLDSVRDLRNILVHNNLPSGSQYATVTQELTDNLDKITDQLLHPVTIDRDFLKKVHCFQSSDHLSELLSAADKYSLTHFPIFDGDHFVTVLSENGVMNWLAASVTSSLLDIDNSRIIDSLKYEEQRHPVVFVRKDASVYSILEIFVSSARRGLGNPVILIADKRPIKGPSDIKGIITLSDMAQIVSIIENEA